MTTHSEGEEDLALCGACLRGETAALERLDRRIATEVPLALRGMRLDVDTINDVAQTLRERLLVPARSDAPAKLADYTGRGALSGWLRVAAVRTALNLTRARRREVLRSPDEDDGLSWPSPDDDPETRLLKRTCGDAFRAAFAKAVESLEARERMLLRQHLLDGLTSDQIGALYAVHGSTAHRWIRAAQGKILDATRRELATQLRGRASDVDSVMRMLGSRLDASVRRVLQAVERGSLAHDGIGTGS